MKKLLLVLFAAGLIAVFSMPAVAADVKFFGDYYAAGYYTSNYSLSENDALNNGGRGTVGQRLRINTIFQVAEGLKLTTRFDAMERAWGQDASLGTPNPTGWHLGAAAPKGTNEENNISWERAFVTFNLGPGFFDVGYQAEGYWSPIAFGNTTGSGAMVRYTAPVGPLTLSAYWEKPRETEFDPLVYAPRDWDRYAIQGIYKWKAGQAGLQVTWDAFESATVSTLPIFAWNSTSIDPGKVNLYEVSPFVQAKLGPVDLEGKAYWSWGKYEPAGTGEDTDIEGLSIYLNGKVNFGPAYVGAMFAYVKGDDGEDDDEVTLSHGGQQDWDPCLMLGNDRFAKWQGGRYSNNIGWGTPGGPLPFRGGWNETNVWIYQGYAGFNPMPKLALKASFTYMKLDELSPAQVAAGFDDHLGNEVDLTAAYKIYPNLEYMVGFGYLWTGDYFKGGTGTDVDNNYLLMHQLTLTF